MSVSEKSDIPCNDPKYLDKQVWANSPDQEEGTDQGLHWLSFCLHLLDALIFGKQTVQTLG